MFRNEWQVWTGICNKSSGVLAEHNTGSISRHVNEFSDGCIFKIERSSEDSKVKVEPIPRNLYDEFIFVSTIKQVYKIIDIEDN